MNSPNQGPASRSASAATLHLSGALLLTLLLAACGSSDGSDPAEPGPVAGTPPASNVISCKGYDGKQVGVAPKTITIYNNSANTLYPVLATSKNAVNEWIQGCLRTTAPHPTDYVYKLYVNEGEGIPPNSSVTLTLPLYSQLADKRYITWWNGGRVVLADRDERLLGKEDTAMETPNSVTCEGHNTACTLSTYSSNVQFPENIYAQLSEYTFGDSIVPAGQSLRLLKPENVGYNISYVDHVYMPVAIGPKNNPYIGYSGSTQPLAGFRNKLTAFLASTSVGEGWPVYNLDELKLPGGYNIFAQRSGTLPPSDNVPVKPADGYPPVLTVLNCINGGCTEQQKKSLHYGEAVQRMQNLWGSCVDWNEDLSAYVTENVTCPTDMKDRMAVIKQFFVQNHQNYLNMYSAGQCQGSTPQKPTFTYWEAMMHIYGWVPFNEGCGAAANPLADTKIPGWDHAKAQSMYIHELQYNHLQTNVQANPKLLFNPYVQLIHDDLEMNAYGFSVDDAVGFMSELGDGLIFTVGGSEGLENTQQFNYADGFTLAIGVPESKNGRANEALIKKYGVCVLNHDANDLKCEANKQDVDMPNNSQIAGFRVGSVASYPIQVRFTDLNDNVYSLRVNTKFAACTEDMDPSQCPANKSGIVDKASCLVTDSKGVKHAKSDDWCVNANPNQQREKQLTKNYLSFPQPVDFMN
ncbi:hypothetical protein [Pusillimonas noertemannii]|uniref:Uncharacterized protein n=1 Tax=Pusillimonas noertemannii TaxID=305977 RepID=A0A2U1CN85_9BURK|nr:hypothetical protein [Pusillimonas noertemannii]NYT68521.1 hypothetical protein [Pusillimonas noertemannii]PVY62462.1 hypothetical protein C7440_1956 [Pusillimonas noertemannii]TFL10577.1 hypothetical protein CSC72_08600 [Pusillimonas noertemannii]